MTIDSLVYHYTFILLTIDGNEKYLNIMYFQPSSDKNSVLVRRYLSNRTIYKANEWIDGQSFVDKLNLFLWALFGW